MQITLDKTIELAELLNKPAMVFSYKDHHLNIVYFSDSIPALYGYNESSFIERIKKDALSFVSDYDSQFIIKGLDRSIETDTPYPVSVQVRHFDGSLVFFDGTFSYIGMDDDSYIFLCVLSDDSGKLDKKNNETLNEAYEKKYKQAIEFAKVLTWDYDILNERLINCNSLCPFNDESTISKDFPGRMIDEGVVSLSDCAMFLSNIEKIRKGYPSVSYDCWHFYPDAKQPMYLHIEYTTEFDKDNNPIIAHAMGIDLSEQKNAEINFKQRTNGFLRMNPESLATFQLNVTKNLCNESTTTTSALSSLVKLDSLDDLITEIVNLISDKNEGMHFINTFSRDSIIQAYNSGVLQLKYEHHLPGKSSKDEWVRTIVDIVKNPFSSDIEAILHIVSIQHQKTIDSLINGTVQREYDFIALAYLKTDTYVIIDRFNQDISDESPNFMEHFRALFADLIQSESELNKLYAEFKIENLVEKINTYGEYTIQFNSCDDPEKNHHRILRFSFLNSRRDIISISCRDTTKLYNEELKQKEKISEALYEAEKANRAKSDFLSLVSHDIRTPLNGIMGMTQLALKEEVNEKVKEYLEKAEMSSSFLLGLINDLLDMSKIESGKVELKPDKYTFAEFKDYLNSVIIPLCEKKNLTFTIEPEDIVNCIIIDKLRFNQIIFNLLSNSCKYTNEGGHITLKINCERVSDELCIGTFIVKDDGIGMSEEFQEHLFETFAQENRMNFDHNEGTGLGLSITHSLIELMGGEISVESEIGVGSTFTVQLTFKYFDEDQKEDNLKEEIESTNTENVINEENESINYEGKNFLLCEDNIINQEIGIEILSKLGASVTVADDGVLGVKAFLKSPINHYSAIFMDIRMPNMDGLSASKAIRDLNREDAKSVPIIAMTANAMSEDKMECVEAGMNAFIAKPINVKELYKIMQSIIK